MTETTLLRGGAILYLPSLNPFGFSDVLVLEALLSEFNGFVFRFESHCFNTFVETIGQNAIKQNLPVVLQIQVCHTCLAGFTWLNCLIGCFRGGSFES